MVCKRKLNNLQDWQDWHDCISDRFSAFNIVNGDTSTPMEYPCIVSWYENEVSLFQHTDDDICAYNFIYFSDFNTNNLDM